MSDVESVLWKLASVFVELFVTNTTVLFSLTSISSIASALHVGGKGKRKDQKEVSTECACVVGWCGFVQNVNEPLNHVVATPDDTIAIKNKRIDHPKQLFPAGNPH